MCNIIDYLPPMLEGEDLINEMRIAPDYDATIRTMSASKRLIALNDIYNVYVPLTMGKHIYNKLFLGMVRGLQRKTTKIAQVQRVKNGKTLMSADVVKNYQGVCSGDSFTIIGDSGIGKSSSVSRVINMITQVGVIELNEPYCKVVPCVVVECPFDCSIKGMLVEILRKIDESVGSNYYDLTISNKKITIDMLIGCVSQACLNHVGLLVVDEIQNVVNHKNGISLVAMLTQLINNSSVSICMVGTTTSIDFFNRINYLSRRTMGLQFEAMKYDEEFKVFCDEIFKYQYVKNKCILDEKIYNWLYLHSMGVCSTIVSLAHDAQELAIIEGIEEISIYTLNMAYEQRLQMMHTHIQNMLDEELPQIRKTSSVKTKVPRENWKNSKAMDENMIESMAIQSKKEKIDILELLKGNISIMEIEVQRNE